jgi:hypothetical protein
VGREHFLWAQQQNPKQQPRVKCAPSFDDAAGSCPGISLPPLPGCFRKSSTARKSSRRRGAHHPLMTLPSGKVSGVPRSTEESKTCPLGKVPV